MSFDTAALERTLGTVGNALVSLSNQVSRISPLVLGLLNKHIRGKPARAILTAIGVLAFYNLAAVWLGGLTNWWGLLTTGWPIELLVISLGLAIVMYAVPTIWLLIPLGITLGHGILFAYCQLIGSWSHWAFLWPLEPVLVGGTVWTGVWLGRHHADSKELAASLGWALCIVSAAWSLIAIILAILVGIVKSFAG
jgi:hypothetical protein